MEFVLIIITSYGLNAELKISEVYFESEQACEEALAKYSSKWDVVNDDKFAYTMRCEARAKG